MVRIEMKDVEFGYIEGHPVITGVDLTIDGPGLYCIIGPNGVGKSTMIKCINKLSEPQKGTVAIDGRDVREMTFGDVSQIISYVAVSNDEVFRTSVSDVMMVGRRSMRRKTSSKEDVEQVYRVLKLLRIRNLAKRNVDELSAGQRQLVYLARAIVRETPVMILDEPTANLDIKHQIYIAELLRAYQMQKGVTVLMICHDLNITSKYAHRIILMEHPGTVGIVGTPSEVITAENIRRAYGVECRVEDAGGYPYIIPDEAVEFGDDTVFDDFHENVFERMRKYFGFRKREFRNLHVGDTSEKIPEGGPPGSEKE